ncbi:MAG TPA: ABC transporter substrate-binding protein [bacterium]|nr:ABC transporter substrate-binding protein [bacterium]
MKKTSLGVLVLCFLASGALVVRAEDSAPAERIPPDQVLLDAINRTLDIVRLPDYKAPEKRAEYRAQVREILMTMIDMRTVSMLVLADKKKAFTDAQFDEFVDSFTRILFLSYVGHLDDYTDQQVQVDSVEEIKDSKVPRVRLKTQTTSRAKGTKTPVEYSMTLTDNKWAAYDVRIEGLSFVSNYRSQFREILTSRKPDQLLKTMKEKADKLEKDNVQIKVDEKIF